MRTTRRILLGQLYMIENGILGDTNNPNILDLYNRDERQDNIQIKCGTATHCEIRWKGSGSEEYTFLEYDGQRQKWRVRKLMDNPCSIFVNNSEVRADELHGRVLSHLDIVKFTLEEEIALYGFRTFETETITIRNLPSPGGSSTTFSHDRKECVDCVKKDATLSNTEENLEQALMELSEARDSNKKKLYSLLENELLCSICKGIFIEPSVLKCMHTFCKKCIMEWTRNSPQPRCPLCNDGMHERGIMSLQFKDFISKCFHSIGGQKEESRKAEEAARAAEIMELECSVAAARAPSTPPHIPLIDLRSSPPPSPIQPRLVEVLSTLTTRPVSTSSQSVVVTDTIRNQSNANTRVRVTIPRMSIGRVSRLQDQSARTTARMRTGGSHRSVVRATLRMSACLSTGSRPLNLNRTRPTTARIQEGETGPRRSHRIRNRRSGCRCSQC